MDPWAKNLKFWLLCLKQNTNIMNGSKTLAFNRIIYGFWKRPKRKSVPLESIHLTQIMSAVKEGQHKYCETVYSRSGINHMWILKNSKDLLDNLKLRSFSQVSSIKTFDFSTLYTTLPHDKLKTA